MSSPGITSTRDLEFWADDDLALGQFYGDERPALLVSELARGLLASRDHVKALEAEVEQLTAAIIEWADSRTRTYGFSSDEEAAQRGADASLLNMARALAGQGDK